jgi:hypothetical protein
MVLRWKETVNSLTYTTKCVIIIIITLYWRNGYEQFKTNSFGYNFGYARYSKATGKSMT